MGSDTPVRVNTRVVAATHRNLKRMVREGTFREDLLFRLNVVNLHLPPLRERLEDIPPLVHHFIGCYRRDLAKPVLGIDNPAMRCLLSYPWPGNVRELSNVIERAMLLCTGEILRIEDLPTDLREHVSAFPQNLSTAVEQLQHRHIASVLESMGGNRVLAAKALGLSPATLYRLLQKLGLKGYMGSANDEGVCVRHPDPCSSIGSGDCARIERSRATRGPRSRLRPQGLRP